MFPLVDDWLLLLGIMVGMDQKDIFLRVHCARCYSGPDALHLGRYEPERQLCCVCARRHVHGWFCGLYLLRCVPFFFRQAQDARHLGWFGPQGQLRCEDWLRASSLRQWHVYCWYAGVDAIHAVFLLMVGRPVMPGIMGVAILVVPASRVAPRWTSPSSVVTGSRGTARDGSDPRLLFLGPSVFACTVVRAALRAFSFLFLEMGCHGCGRYSLSRRASR